MGTQGSANPLKLMAEVEGCKGEGRKRVRKVTYRGWEVHSGLRRDGRKRIWEQWGGGEEG